MAQLHQRLHGKLPNQLDTSYCGCAAFLVCLLIDRPDIYVAYAIALWTGNDYTFHALRRSLEVSATPGTMKALSDIQGRKSRSGFINDLDWMTMASLSAASHGGAPRNADDSGGIFSQFNAITWPSMIRKWFGAVGCQPQLDSVGFGVVSCSSEDVLDLLALWDHHWLVMEIDASLLNGGGASIKNRHWVVVNPVYRPTVQPEGKGARQFPAAYRDAVRKSPWGSAPPPVEANSAMSMVRQTMATVGRATVDMQVVSWADDTYRFRQPTLDHIASLFYGGYAFPRIR